MRVCLVSHGPPSANPRLVREADALFEAGCEVFVITTRFVERWVRFDQEMMKSAGWQYRYVNLLRNPTLWNYVRARRRLAEAAVSWFPMDFLISRACNYANPELANLAAQTNADLYVAHQHHALPAATSAAIYTRGLLGFDAQDLLADSSAEPQQLIREIERRYVPRCAYVSTMSHAAARRLHETNRLARDISVLHNTPRIRERSAVHPPGKRPPSPVPSIYWFGQTIGLHSRAEQVLKALPLLSRPVRLVLRGTPSDQYVRGLQSLAATLGVGELLEIAPLDAPDRMVQLAAEHDILLGAQPGRELFHQLAIGNKVFTGMMAGLALALTDTIAHRELLRRAPGCGFLFADGDEINFAKQIERFFVDPGLLQRMKQSSWDWATREFNWETESRRHVEMIETLGSGAHR